MVKEKLCQLEIEPPLKICWTPASEIQYDVETPPFKAHLLAKQNILKNKTTTGQSM